MITILLVLVIVLVNLFNKGTFAISTTTTYIYDKPKIPKSVHQNYNNAQFIENNAQNIENSESRFGNFNMDFNLPEFNWDLNYESKR